MSSQIQASRPVTRIQREKQEVILEAALDVFSQYGFRGSTIDQIAAKGYSLAISLYVAGTEAVRTGGRIDVSEGLTTWREAARDSDASIDDVLAFLRAEVAA